ncbi:hypothetical protein EVAR_97751_1 [Eumeta japonica]|uniref:Uncharacterized protein n=1 Tax=Eumeta variegata TaxID=151549 RepID=A0A4C1XA87_EUMVA|nr:hypothetical protein EVAR_97751_1 [Eumeta japonica]
MDLCIYVRSGSVFGYRASHSINHTPVCASPYRTALRSGPISLRRRKFMVNGGARAGSKPVTLSTPPVFAR